LIDDNVSYEECLYASDGILTTPLSTEVFLSPHRGRSIIVPRFKGAGLTDELVRNVFTQEALQDLERTNGVKISSSSKELAVQISELEVFDPVPEDIETTEIEDVLLK
jgi:hypothetical protein